MEPILRVSLIGLGGLAVVGIVLSLFLLSRIYALRRENEEAQRALRRELSESNRGAMNQLGQLLADSQRQSADAQLRQLTLLQGTITDQLGSVSRENEQKMEQMRRTMEIRLMNMQQDNSKKLDQMREVVDEKLQKTLEDRMTQSFRLVSERLEQVYKGLGEMQTLAAGVGDLKKVLSNVKTRGILGEIQLGAILAEVLSPEQYLTNTPTQPGSRNVVEFAVKLPNEDGSHTLLPIDAKFPGDSYAALRDAYDDGDPARIQAAANTLCSRLKAEAKDIRDKYISPPYTTEFGILFLPFEGLYAEAVNRGMVEVLQREYRVNLAGPSTMAALLNSLQMGFRSFAIQQRSGEVWQVLGAVKTEFEKFSDALRATQQRLEQAGDELDKLVGVRTRQMQRKLKNVTSLTAQQTASILPPDGADDELLPEEE